MIIRGVQWIINFIWKGLFGRHRSSVTRINNSYLFTWTSLIIWIFIFSLSLFMLLVYRFPLKNFLKKKKKKYHLSNKKGLNEVILKSLMAVWFCVYKNWYIIKDFSWHWSNPSCCKIFLKPKSSFYWSLHDCILNCY